VVSSHSGFLLRFCINLLSPPAHLIIRLIFPIKVVPKNAFKSKVLRNI
jgi:hypothetical protein